MAASFLSFLDNGVVAVGLPPTGHGESEPMGLIAGLVMIGAFALAFWGAVRLVTWLDVRLACWVLLRDIHRDLGIGGSGARRTRRSSRPPR